MSLPILCCLLLGGLVSAQDLGAGTSEGKESTEKSEATKKNTERTTTKMVAHVIHGGEEFIVVDTTLEPSLIAKAVQTYITQIRYCYSKNLTRYPDLEGDITIEFDISAEGKATNPLVKKTTLGNKDVENCVAHRITRIQYPKPTDGKSVKVLYPFYFSAEPTTVLVPQPHLH